MFSIVDTQFSLLEWAETIGIHPFSLAQISEPRAKIRGTDCTDVFYQNPYNSNNQLSREQIADCISRAESMISNFLSFWIAPKHEHDVIPYVAPKEDFRGFYSSPQQKLRYGILNRFGVYSITEHETDVSVNYLPNPIPAAPNNFPKTFTISVTVPSGTLPRDVLVFFSEADRGTLSIDAMQPRVRGASVTVSGTTATITGPAMLLIKPELMLDYAPQKLDARTLTNYVETVDIYLQSYDSENPALYTYYPLADCESLPCLPETVTGCVLVADNPGGLVHVFPAEYANGRWQALQSCDLVHWDIRGARVDYETGVPRDNLNRIARPYASLIARLATALLPERTCGCTQADNQIQYYRKPELDDEGRFIATEEIISGATQAFGVTGRGAIQVYAELSKMQFNDLYHNMHGGY